MPIRRNATELKIAARLPDERQSQTIEGNLWTAIRALQSFSTKDVALQASTDDLWITEAVAEQHLRRLRDAGYVVAVRDLASRSSTWRLVPRMNTGPKPPLFLQVRLIFDRNLRRGTEGPFSEEAML